MASEDGHRRDGRSIGCCAVFASILSTRPKTRAGCVLVMPRMRDGWKKLLPLPLSERAGVRWKKPTRIEAIARLRSLHPFPLTPAVSHKGRGSKTRTDG